MTDKFVEEVIRLAGRKAHQALLDDKLDQAKLYSTVKELFTEARDNSKEIGGIRP